MKRAAATQREWGKIIKNKNLKNSHDSHFIFQNVPQKFKTTTIGWLFLQTSKINLKRNSGTFAKKLMWVMAMGHAAIQPMRAQQIYPSGNTMMKNARKKSKNSSGVHFVFQNEQKSIKSKYYSQTVRRKPLKATISEKTRKKTQMRAMAMGIICNNICYRGAKVNLARWGDSRETL